jgi:hypothetical protein
MFLVLQYSMEKAMLPPNALLKGKLINVLLGGMIVARKISLLT